MTCNPKLDIKRQPERGKYKKDEIIAVLDKGYLAHVGFVDDGLPYVMPTLYARIGDYVYLHAAIGNRFMGILRKGSQICIEITLVDGMVLADSLFAHSMNYRSVMLFSRGEEVKDTKEKTSILVEFSERLVPGRSSDARGPSELEVKQTGLFKFKIDKASAKIRTGPPSIDKNETYVSSWTGVVPISEHWGSPQPSERCKGSTIPAYLKEKLNGLK